LQSCCGDGQGIASSRARRERYNKQMRRCKQDTKHKERALDDGKQIDRSPAKIIGKRQTTNVAGKNE